MVKPTLESTRQVDPPVRRGRRNHHQTINPEDQWSDGPQVGQVWRLIIQDQRRYEKEVILKLLRRTELTYSWCDPDDSIYHPIPWHVLIRDCILLERIPEDWQTRIVGVDESFYDERILRGPMRPKPAVNWSFDPKPYLEDYENYKRSNQESTTDQFN